MLSMPEAPRKIQAYISTRILNMGIVVPCTAQMYGKRASPVMSRNIFSSDCSLGLACGILERMVLWSKLVRCMAFFLVLFVIGEVATCDLVSGSDCSSIQTSQDQQPAPSHCDQCLCCCAQLIPALPARVVSVETASWSFPLHQAPRPVMRSMRIEHPPQLS